MKKKVIIIGAGGHGKVVADSINLSGDSVIGFLDDDPKIEGNFMGIPVLGTVDCFKDYEEYYFIIAIGNALIREKIANKMSSVKWYTAIHPSAVISSLGVTIGKGTVIMANAVVNAGASIGNHCIINSGAIVEHDNRIEDFAHVSVGVNLAGTVYIGKRTWVGIGASVSNNLSVCKDCMIGAGAIVVKNIKESGTYVGIPAERIDMDRKVARGGNSPSD
ncbi:MAG: acetyltransferase [Clostridiales bacterium]|nr:acetyltransferase [Clostridiales bacterium]